MKNALLPHFDQCGARGQERPSGSRKRGRPPTLAQATGQPPGLNVNEEIRQLFRRGVKLFYEIPEGHSLAKAYRLTLYKFFHRGYEDKNGVAVPILPPAEELPTLTQFRYWYQKEKQVEQSIRARVGSRRFATHHRAILGDSTQMAFGSGSVFQFDATVPGIYLVSSLDPLRIIGRPVLYLVIDVFSRLIVGFSVSLEGPSWTGAMLALENAMTDKVAFCQRYGITISPSQWPSHHQPQRILADRGELEGYNADHLVNGLGIGVANTPPYRADWKGIVERYFRLTEDRIIRWLPGAVRRDRSPGEPDTRLDACLTLHEFIQIIIYCVLEHNNEYRMDWYDFDEFMIADRLEPYPLNLWEWGVQNRVGYLRTSSAEAIRLNLLPQGQAAIARDGIHFQGLRYTCPLAEEEGWFVKARQHGRERVTVVYDPRLVDLIYLRLDDRRRLETCYLLDRHKTYRGRDWYETLDSFAFQKERQAAANSRRLQAEAEYEAYIAHVVEGARQRQATALEAESPSKTARLKDIQENRQAERDLERQQGAWQLIPPETAPALEANTEASILTSPDQGYVPAPQNIDLLRQIREKKLKGEMHHEA